MAENNLVSTLWFLFFLLFSTLSIKSFRESRRELKHLRPRISGKIVALGVNFASFLKEFRDFYRSTQKASGISYALAALTALFSFTLSLKN